MNPAGILLLGTGSFAARIAFDIAATARDPVAVVIAGRNRARLQERLRAVSPDLAAGFDMADLDRVHGAMQALRAHLQALP